MPLIEMLRPGGVLLFILSQKTRLLLVTCAAEWTNILCGTFLREAVLYFIVRCLTSDAGKHNSNFDIVQTICLYLCDLSKHNLNAGLGKSIYQTIGPAGESQRTLHRIQAEYTSTYQSKRFPGITCKEGRITSFKCCGYRSVEE